MRWSINSATPRPNAPALAGLAMALVSAYLILTLPRPLNVALVPAIAVGVAYLLYPLVAPLVLVATVPVQLAGVISVGGLGLSATKLAVAGAAAALAVYLVTWRLSIRWSIIVVPFAAYLLAMALSLRHAENLPAAIAEIYRWVVALLAFLLVLYAVRRRGAVLALIAVMALGAAGEALLGMRQALLNLGPASFAAGGGLSRAFGTFGEPNPYAGYLEMTSLLLFPVGIWSIGRARDSLRQYRDERARGSEASRSSMHSLIGWATLALWLGGSGLAGLAGIALSLSRGAWLGVAAALVAMVLLSARRPPILRIGLLILVVGFFAAGGMDFAPAALQERYDQLVSQARLFDSRDVVVTPENFAAVERMAHWQAGIAMFNSSPFTGIGIGNFNDRYREFDVNPAFTVSRGHAHNYYINAAAETGIVGLLAYLALMGTALAISIRACRRSTDNLGRAIGLGAVGVTIAVMVHNIVEDLHVLNLGIQLSAVWALAVIALRGWARSESTTEHPIEGSAARA